MVSNKPVKQHGVNAVRKTDIMMRKDERYDSLLHRTPAISALRL